MKLHFAVLCQDVKITDEGKLQLHEPIVNLSSDRKPAIHNAVVVLNFNPGDMEPHSAEVSVRAPYGKGGSVPYKSNVTSARAPGGDIGHIIYIDELILDEEGEYNVDVMVDGKKMISIPFSFSVIPCDTCCPAK